MNLPVPNISLFDGTIAEIGRDALVATLELSTVSADDFEEPPEVELVRIIRNLRDPTSAADSAPRPPFSKPSDHAPIQVETTRRPH